MNLSFLKNTKEFKALLQAISEDKTALDLSGVCEEAKPYFLTMLMASTPKPVVLIRSSSASLFSFKEECEFIKHQLKISDQERSPKLQFLQDEDISIFPALSSNPYDHFSPSLEAVSQRMRFFYNLIHKPPALILTNLPALLKPVPGKDPLRSSFLTLETEQRQSRDKVIKTLSSFGYSKEDLVDSHGEYAWRGGIVDSFSPWSKNPIRIEFSGDKVVSIREFETSTQRSISRKDRIVIPSLHEFPSTEEFISDWEQIALENATRSSLSDLENMIEEIKAGRWIPSFDYHSLLNKKVFVSFTHYLKNAVFVIDEPDVVEKEWLDKLDSLQKAYSQSEKDGKFVLPPEKLYLIPIWEEIHKKALRISRVLPIEKPPAQRKDSKPISFSFQPIPRFDNKIPFFIQYLKRMHKEREQCFLFFSKKKVMDKISIMLSQENIPFQEIKDPFLDSPQRPICLHHGSLAHGFSYPPFKIHFFSENEIFTEEKVLDRRPPPKPFESFFRDLQTGDYVVHADYGIGIFTGLVKMQIEQRKNDFIQIDYRDEDKLFLPVEDMNLVQKYAGVGTAKPMIHKLGTPAWNKTKSRTKKAVEKIAKELLQLYAKRKALRGHRFSAGGNWEKDFEETFEYDETEDQLLAIKNVIQDMESPSPMDRLLCGDVGYGKTEVAMRAAFKAVMDGKQVAVLCPTTVLASQHLKTFQSRMSLFPVKVMSLTRLQSKQEQKETIQLLKKGIVDIIIGTHRLLSADIQFRDLGILIIDEEQRFGVKQKEKIKQLKAEIDVLTMTATPIPRTLNLSLSGIRDISLIETPPKDRLAIHTVVTSFNKALIQDAIKKELSRGGQIYFVHNRIDDIEDIASKLRSWIPGLRLTVIHGRMPGSLLEKNMIDFIEHKSDVLISTTIIENGIDIPLVNTLIVNQADRFGLAQLYQLRGRVGRSSRQAMAYLLVSPSIELTGQAKERLKALQEFSELGSGFRLAAKDLEIRGAGHFLGADQHGYVEAVGYDYYMLLLKNAVKKLKGESAEEVISEINLKVDIRIPEKFLPQMNLRLNLYKRISSAENEGEIVKIKDEISDRFGPLPQSLKNLLNYGRIKILAHHLLIKKIDRTGSRITLEFYSETPADPKTVTHILKKHQGAMRTERVLEIPLSSNKDPAVLDETISILKRLEGM